MKFEDVLGDFSEKLGIGRLEPDAGGSVALLFDDLHEITFTPDADDGSLLMYCEIADAARLEKEDLERLLKVSLLGAETGGAAFGIHKPLRKIVLWKRYDNSFSGVTDLENRVNAFLAQVIFWKEHLEDRPSENKEALNFASGTPESGFGYQAMPV